MVKTTNNKYLTVIDAEYVDWYSEYTDKFWERTYFSIFIVNGSWAEVSWLWLNYDHTHSVCSWERHPWGRHWTAWYMKDDEKAHVDQFLEIGNQML